MHANWFENPFTGVCGRIVGARFPFLEVRLEHFLLYSEI